MASFYLKLSVEFYEELKKSIAVVIGDLCADLLTPWIKYSKIAIDSACL